MNEVRAALKFNLSTIPKNVNITSAKLELYRFEGVLGDKNTWDNPTTFEVRTITESWSAADNKLSSKLFSNWTDWGSSYNNELIGSDEYIPPTKGWFEFDVLEAVKNMVKNPSSNHGFMIFSNGYVKPENGGSVSKFRSATDPLKKQRPKLTITYSDATDIAHKSKQPNNKAELLLNSSTSNIIMSIINARGQEIVSSRVTSTIDIDNMIKPLKSGVYVCRYSSEGETLLTHKLAVDN